MDAGLPTWNGLEGDIVSGADFVLFRIDGVLRLDGRITIRARDGILIDAAYNGLVDLYGGRGFGTDVAIPSQVVLEALRGRLPYGDGADEEARTTLQGIGDAVSAAANLSRAADAYISAARTQLEAYATSKWGPGDKTARVLEQFDRERRIQINELNPVAEAIARALPANNGLRLQERLRQAAESGARTAAAAEGWVHVQAALRMALGQSEATEKEAQAIYLEIHKNARGSDLVDAFDEVTEKRARMIGDTLGKAITQRYRDREADLFENIVNRSVVQEEPVNFGAHNRAAVDVIVPIAFETASGPWSDAPGEDMSWVGSEYRVNESKFWQYRQLVRRAFVAQGTLSLDRGERGRPPQPSNIDMDVFELVRGAGVQ
jgi:hypothetical protein